MKMTPKKKMTIKLKTTPPKKTASKSQKTKK